MECKQMQKIVDEWIETETNGYWRPNNMMLRLMEEVGELAKEVNHVYGEKPRKLSDAEEDIGHELGDIFFTIICVANSLNIDLEQAFQYSMAKYRSRDKDRHK